MWNWKQKISLQQFLSCGILAFQSHRTRLFNAKHANHILKKTSKFLSLVYHHFRAITQEAGAHWLLSHGLFGRTGMDKEAGGLNNWGVWWDLPRLLLYSYANGPATTPPPVESTLSPNPPDARTYLRPLCCIPTLPSHPTLCALNLWSDFPLISQCLHLAVPSVKTADTEMSSLVNIH